MDIGPPPAGFVAWLEFIAKAAAGATGVLLLIKYGRAALAWCWRPFGEFGMGLRAMRQLPTLLPALGRVQALDQSVAAILREVRPNGGSSLRDEVRLIAAEQQRQSEELRRTTAGLTILANTQRVMFDAGATAVFECTPDDGNIYVNHVYQRWTGMSETQLLGFGWVNAVALPDRAAVREEWEAAVEDEREFRMRYRMNGRDGAMLDVTVTASPVRDTEGVVTKWLGVVYQHDPIIDEEL